MRFTRLGWFVMLFALLLPAAPALAGGVAVVGTVLTDNGDGDAFADTQETVTLRLVLRNTTGLQLSGVVARLTTTDGAITCLTRSLITVGDLAPGEERVTEQGFEFVVPPTVNRASVGDDLAVRFAVSIWATPGEELATTRWIDLDLDLDVSGGSGPTVFFEGFEDGFGAFTTMHLDQGLNPPDSDQGNWQHALLLADGFRCQYHDPEWIVRICDPGGCGTFDCFPNPNGAPDAFYFDVVTDRAYSGMQSMGFNIFLGEVAGYTTPTAQLEAIRTLDPVNLAWDSACSVSRTACSDDLGCAPGETCDPAAPKLSLKHQISHMDHRSLPAQPGRTADRSVIAVQPTADDGTPAGPWVKVYPFVNGYDSQANSNYFNCSFDPTDDGNTEGDFFDPSDPIRSQGPSSTCAPEFSFADQGDTDGPFDPAAVGSAEPGAGLEGELGHGTWVEPIVDLSRFRGRRIRVRFLSTGLKLGGFVHWDQALGFNPDSGDDGWFIDDVTVTDALTLAAAVAPDVTDNSGLPYDLLDLESDGVLDACDNCPLLGNAGQSDRDADGVGDACDPCPDDAFNDIDADGRCAGDDNCPFAANPTQADSDGDGYGDACDACPLHFNGSGSLDEDQDGIDCPADNCGSVPNADQADADGDGIGDACDPCPGDTTHDPDGDGVCGTLDNCPFAANPGQDRSVRLRPLTHPAFLLSPDSSTVVGRDSAQGRLFSVPAVGGPAVALSTLGVLRYQITTDGTAVVYLQATGDRGLYRVPLGGGARTRLAPEVGSAEVVREFALTPDGSRVVYTLGNGTLDELYSVPSSGGPPVWLGALGPAHVLGSVRISPTGARVLYRSGNGLFNVAIDGGAATPLTPGLASFVTMQAAEFSPDGARVVYVADADQDNVFELYSVPADASGPPVKLNGPLLTLDSDVLHHAANEAPFRISPDGSTVAYIADQAVDGRFELFAVSILGGDAQRLNPPLSALGDVGSFVFTPDGSRMVFTAQTQSAGGSELLAVALPEFAGPAWYLADWGTDDRVGPFSITPDGTRVVYRRSNGSDGALYAVALAGGDAVPLSADPVVDLGEDFRISADGTRILYGAGSPSRLYGVSIDGGPPVELSEGRTAEGGAIRWSGDASIAFWVTTATPVGGGDLVATWLDPDADGDDLHAACDCDESLHGAAEANDGLDGQCPGEPGFGLIDELGGVAGFTDPTEPNRFGWTPQPGAVEYEVVRSGDPGFATDCACTRVRAIGVVLTEEPQEGAVFYYLPRAFAPHRGSAGADSSGVERDGACLSDTCGVPNTEVGVILHFETQSRNGE